jgi:hypothetical protein
MSLFAERLPEPIVRIAGPTCPVCGKPQGDKILVCETCWKTVPQKDQSNFRRIFNKFRSHEASWRPLADKIIRNLKAKLAADRSPVAP